MVYNSFMNDQRLKWLGFALILVGVVIRTSGYSLIIDFMFQVVGCSLWAHVAVKTKDWPLLAVNATIIILNIWGIFRIGFL